MRFVVLVYIAGSGSETSTANSFRFTTKAAAEAAMEFFKQFTSHVTIIEDI